MSIANFQEKLLFIVKQKSRLGLKLSDVQMRQLQASQAVQEKQQEFNAQLTSLYYDEEVGYGTDQYSEILLQMTNEHEFELASINSWESQLELEKEMYETQMNEVTSYENSWLKLLQQNIKVEFTYGGGGK